MTTVEEEHVVKQEQEEEEADDGPPWYKNSKTLIKIAIILVVLTVLTLAIAFNKVTGRIIESFLEWMVDNAVLGSFVFIAVYWFCTVMFIPGSLLTLGAGFVFRKVAGPVAGLFLATIVVLVGAGLGASTAFLLGRFVFREKVASYKQKYEKFDIIDKVVEQQGLKVTLLLRLSPIIPFSAFNYIMSLTGVSFRNYNLAHIGMLPGTLAYCFIGGTVGAIGDSASDGSGGPLTLILTIVGTLVAIVGMVYISWVAKKEFAKIAAQQMDDELAADGKDTENPENQENDALKTDPKAIEATEEPADDQPEESLTVN